MEVSVSGKTYVCIEHLDGRVNPFWLYREWWDQGKHRKLIVKYGDAVSVLYHLTDIYAGRA